MKKKLILLIIITVLFLCLLLFIFLNKENKETDLKEEELISLKLDKIEVYKKYNISDVIELKNSFSLADDYLIDTSKLGEIRLDIKYFDESKDIKEGFFNIEVVDTTPPYIGVGKTYNHIIDTNFTFYKDVICADNYDKHVKCEIVGDYDLSVLGDNQVLVVATDSHNNRKEKEVNIKVVQKTTPKKEYIELSDALKNKPNGAVLMIDVSKWQEEIDWKKVKEAGIDYAMLRLGTQKAVDEESVLDKYFERNIEEAKKNNIKVGVYYYSYANDKEDAKKGAEWVIDNLKKYEIDLPIAFDWECFRFFNDFDLSINDLNEIARTFLLTIEKNGYQAINYSSKNYLINIWDLKDFKVWLAHYVDETDYEDDYMIWQFTDSGKVPGIKGGVDLNYLFLNN